MFCRTLLSRDFRHSIIFKMCSNIAYETVTLSASV